MIIDYACSRCGDDHALPVDQCPNVGRAPRPVRRGPTPEQQHTWAMREAEYRIAAETREQREADQAQALEQGKLLALGREVVDHARQEKYAAAAAACARGRTDVHASREAQDQAQRLQRNQRVRDRERGQG
jgi:hypothetical protein